MIVFLCPRVAQRSMVPDPPTSGNITTTITTAYQNGVSNSSEDSEDSTVGEHSPFIKHVEKRRKRY